MCHGSLWRSKGQLSGVGSLFSLVSEVGFFLCLLLCVLYTESHLAHNFGDSLVSNGCQFFPVPEMEFK